MNEWMNDVFINVWFAQVNNKETKLDWKLNCAGQQRVRLTNSWPRDNYEHKLQITQYKWKIYNIQITEQ